MLHFWCPKPQQIAALNFLAIECRILVMQATVYVYELAEEEVKVDKIEFSKATAAL